MNEEIIKILVNSEAIIVILSWLFGLLSATITSHLLKYITRNNLKNLLNEELINLTYELSGASFLIELNVGRTNKDKFEIIKQVWQNPHKNIQALQLDISTINFEKYENFVKQSKSEKHLSLKILPIAFITASIPNLWVFKQDYQKDILWVVDRIGIINQEIQNARSQSYLTYNPEIMNTNSDVIQQNVKSSYASISDQCIELTKHIKTTLLN